VVLFWTIISKTNEKEKLFILVRAIKTKMYKIYQYAKIIA